MLKTKITITLSELNSGALKIDSDVKENKTKLLIAAHFLEELSMTDSKTFRQLRKVITDKQNGRR